MHGLLRYRAEDISPSGQALDETSQRLTFPTARSAGTFESFSPSARKEYVEWITEAKQDATRQKRLATTVEWLAEGKKRNWKYENC